MLKKFNLLHSLAGSIVLLGIEFLLITLYPVAADLIVCTIAIVGAAGNLYVATEVVEEVRNVRRMISLLTVVLSEFVVFFAFQYSYLLMTAPDSFPTLSNDPLSMLLHSTMIFVFNPLYLPGSTPGRTLLLINTIAALGLVFFVIQNIWQLRNPKAQ